MPSTRLGQGMLNWSGKVRFNKVYFGTKNEPLKFSCAQEKTEITEKVAKRNIIWKSSLVNVGEIETSWGWKEA